MAFIINVLVVILTGMTISCLINFKEAIDRLIVGFVVCISQVIINLMVAGILLNSLYPKTIFLISIAELLIAMSLLSKYGAEKYVWKYNWGILEIFDVKSRWTSVLMFICCIEVVWLCILIYLFPSYSYDSLMYHLVSVADWVQNGKIGITPYIEWTNVYPQNAELIFTWLVIFLKSDIIVDAGQLIFAMGGFLAVIGISRRMNVGRDLSIASACIFLLTPIVLAQSITNYVDLAYASMFLVFFYFYISYMEKRDYRYALFSGISAGITLGLKSSAVAYVGVCAIVVLIKEVYLIKRKERELKSLGITFVLFIVPFIIFGGFWYIRTWIVYGNPIYPFSVTLFGRTIFEGRGTVHDLIMLANTPKEMLGLSKVQRIWMSWKNIFIDPSYDQGIGGLGAHWLFLGFPSLIFLSINYVLKNKSKFFVTILPVWLIFIIQPSNWWSRYTIYIAAFGSIAFVYWLNKCKFWMGTILKFISIILIVASLYSGWDHLFFNKTYVHQTAKAPAELRTVGHTLRQEYKWVDYIEKGSVIASTSANPFFYPLFGDGYVNKVLNLDDINKDNFINELEELKVNYIFIVENDEYESLIVGNEDRFELVDKMWIYGVYKFY